MPIHVNRTENGGGGRLGLLFGHALPDGAFRAAATPRRVDTPFGPVTVLDVGLDGIDAADGIIALRRHGHDTFVPAHLIDHRANIAALAAAGCNRLVALGSVGSLRRDWPVGTVVCPDDFFAPWANPTYHDDAEGHAVPGFATEWRSTVLEAWNAAGTRPAIDGGVYAQTIGPRFETAAEVRFLAGVADVVGMTIASEAILAREAGLDLVALCSVDNLANGLADQPLTVEEFRAGKAANEARMSDDTGRLLRRLLAIPG